MEQEDVGSSATRIYVSGLPPSMTKDQIWSHFTATGKYTVTDAHVIPDRRMAFVGFSSHDQANSAVHYFNKSFVRMSKISVTLAKPVQVKRDGNGQAVPVSERVSRKRKRHIHDEGKEPLREPTFQRPGKEPAPIDRQPPPKPAREPQDDPLEEKDSRPQRQPNEGGTDDSVTADAPKSDMDWLRGKTNRTLDLVDETENTFENENDRPLPIQVEDEVSTRTAEDSASIRNQQASAEETEDQDSHEIEPPSVSIPNARLFIRNLPFNTQEGDLRAVFAPYGRISEVSVSPMDYFYFAIL